MASIERLISRETAEGLNILAWRKETPMTCDLCKQPTMVPLREREPGQTATLARIDPLTGRQVVCVECLHDAYIKAADGWHESEMANRDLRNQLDCMLDDLRRIVEAEDRALEAAERKASGE